MESTTKPIMPTLSPSNMMSPSISKGLQSNEYSVIYSPSEPAPGYSTPQLLLSKTSYMSQTGLFSPTSEKSHQKKHSLLNLEAENIITRVAALRANHSRHFPSYTKKQEQSMRPQSPVSVDLSVNRDLETDLHPALRSRKDHKKRAQSANSGKRNPKRPV